MIEITNKILMVLFFGGCLNVLRHGYYFLQALLISTEETPIKYKLKPKSLMLLGISIAYILTGIFTGIKI